jgi:hypothetical protein
MFASSYCYWQRSETQSLQGHGPMAGARLPAIWHATRNTNQRGPEDLIASMS